MLPPFPLHSNLGHYFRESVEWQQYLANQHNELPELKAMLKELPSIKMEATASAATPDLVLNEQLRYQQMAMDQLNLELELQLCRLTKEGPMSTAGNMALFCTQDILRQQIIAVQKQYNELKSNMLTLLPPVL